MRLSYEDPHPSGYKRAGGIGWAISDGDLTYQHFLSFVIGGVLFDIDHLFYFLAAYRTLDIKKLYDISMRLYNTTDTKIYIFHTFEFMIIFGFGAYLVPVARYAYAGYILHCICDFLRIIYIHRKEPRKFLLWLRFWFLFWNLKLNLPLPKRRH